MPANVQVYDFGEITGVAYFAMEYVNGGRLSPHLGGTPQPHRPAAELMEEVAQAVGFAHRHGIVHRDVKPANVLLASPYEMAWKAGSGAPTRAHQLYGIVKVADFGLVRWSGRGVQEQEGTILGTPAYMSPEQASGRTDAVGPASDVWAMGATLYEMLTGQTPFREKDLVETMLAVLKREVVPPCRFRPVPPDLEAICLKCLQKDPSRRYADGLELAADLRRFLDGKTVSARPRGIWHRLLFWRS